MQKKYEEASIKNLPDSEVEITVSIPSENLSSYKTIALKKLQERADLPGFRKGKAPEKLVIEKVGEKKILEEAAELALKEVYPEIVQDKGLDVIGNPEVNITKLAEGNPLEFKIKVAIFPTIKLPDYKNILEGIPEDETILVTEEDVNKVVEEIRNTRKKGDEVPQITDDFVKTLGNFENVLDFNKKIKEGLFKEKEYKNKEKRRLSIAEKLIEKTEVSVPKVLIEGEKERMFSQFTHDVKRMGLSTAEYLNKIKKTEVDLKKEWQESAKGRVKLELALQKIAEVENIKAPEEEVGREIKHIIEHHQGADEGNVRPYVEHQLRNEEVFKFLENQK